MRKNIAKIFNIQGLVVYTLKFDGKNIFIQVGKPKKEAICYRCKAKTKNVHAYGRQRLVKHQVLGDKIIYLVFKPRRFMCQNCQLPFTERLISHPWRRITYSFENQVITELRWQPFKAIFQRLSLRFAGARKVLLEKINPLLASWREEEKEERIILGIDEYHFKLHQAVILITNLINHTIKTILPNDRKITLKLALRNIPEEIRGKIKEVCCDMKNTFIQTIKEELPQAKIVIDHFHIVQDANRRVDEARRIEKGVYPKERFPSRKLFLKNREDLTPTEKLLIDSFLKHHLTLHFSYWAKERLRDIYRLSSKLEAERKLTDLIILMDKSDDYNLIDWARTLRRHKEYLLNFFDSPTTNGYTEGANSKLDMIKRISFGFKNIDTFVRKAVLAFLPLSFINYYHNY